VLTLKQQFGFLNVYNFQFPYPWKPCFVLSWFPGMNLSVATFAHSYLEAAHVSQYEPLLRSNAIVFVIKSRNEHQATQFEGAVRATRALQHCLSLKFVHRVVNSKIRIVAPMGVNLIGLQYNFAVVLYGCETRSLTLREEH
jgi:hypothetical protein